MKAQQQLELWVAGKSVHNDERGECCPDFSCCSPELLAPKETREAFQRASQNERMEILMMFLGTMMNQEAPDTKVHIAGDVPGTIQ